MPPTLVNVAVGVLIGIALLGAAFDRRSLALVACAAAAPDLDAVVSLFVPGAANAVLHSGFIPVTAAALLYWETTWRSRSWVRRRTGWYGIRVAWVAIGTYAVAGIGLDLFNVESVALLYPFSDRYFAIVGQFVISTQEGVIQTYLEFDDGWIRVTSPGTMATYQVESWVNPLSSPDSPVGADRRVRIVDRGWQLVIVVAAATAIPAKILTHGSDG